MLDVDTIQVKLASRLRFHLFAFFCLGFIYTRSAWNTFGVLFLAGDAGSSCDVSIKKLSMKSVQGSEFNQSSINSTTEDTNHVSDQSSLLMATECEVIVSTGNGSNMPMPCTYGWVYGWRSESTQVSEWDLVCVRAHLATMSTTLYLVGSMLGALLITPFSDRFGRRPILILCLLVQTIFGSCVAWSPNYSVFVALRFFVGFFNMAVSLCAFVMMAETFPARHRAIPCLGFQAFWATGIMCTGIFGYAIRHWQHLQLAMSLPNIICAFLVWLLPESLPWLISRNKLSQAQEVMEMISRFNCTSLPNDLFVYETLPLQHSEPEDHLHPEETLADQYVIEQPLLSEPTSPTEKNFRDSSLSDSSRGYMKEDDGLVLTNHSTGASHEVNVADTTAEERDFESSSSPGEETGQFSCPATMERSSMGMMCLSSRMRLYVAIIFYLFFVNSLSYYGISLSMPILHAYQFLNLFLLGATEIPAYLVCVALSVRAGRKVPLMMFLLVCGFLNIMAMLISEQASSGMSIARIVSVMASKFAITGAYATVYLYAAEIFPTPVRSQTMGMSSFFENLGGMTAPFIVFAAKSLLEMPAVLFGIMCIGGSMMVFAMPETSAQPLPQTVAEAETLGMCKRRRHQ